MRKTMKILISALLVLCMVMPMATMVFAAGNADTASVYTGEKNNPEDWSKQDWIDNFANYETELTIDSAYELVTFAQASASLKFTDATVVTVTTDIVLNEGDVKDWVVDATGLFAFPGITNFVGTFDGNGKSVSGVYVNYTGTSNGSGFFPVLSAGTTTIKDFAVVNSLFTSKTTNYAPTLVGRITGASNVTLSGLYSNAIITHSTVSNAGTGGIVSLITTNSGYTPTIKGCVFDGCIIAAGTVGGIVGLVANYQAYFSANVTDCANFGTFNGATTVGGIVGNGNNLTINNCINYTGEALVGTMYSESISGNVNYVFAGQKVDGKDYYMGDAATISEDNKGDGAYDLDYLDFGETWTVRANDYPVPKAVYENFGKYFGSFKVPAYDAPNATVSVYTGFKNNADDWDSAAWKANYVAGGSYTIDSAYELMSFATAGISFKADTTVTLTKDIVLNEGTVNAVTAANLVVFPQIKSFAGTFDGDGHYVSGVYVDHPGTSANTYAGFFDVLATAGTTVKDLAIVNSLFTTTKGSAYGASVVCRINSSANITLSGLYSNAIVISTGNSGNGGIVSLISAGAANAPTIEKCVFEGFIDAAGSQTGGIVGFVADYNTSNAIISDCANFGYGVNGGIVGKANTLTINRCIDYTGTKLVGSYTNITGADNYLFDGQEVATDFMEETNTISADNKGDGALDLEALDFENTWAVRANEYPVPQPTVAYVGTANLFGGDVSVYTGVKNNVDDWTSADWKANYAEGGTYTIDSAFEFVSFAKAGLTFKADATVKLTTDVVINQGNAEDWATTAPSVLWTPIKNFTGTFDGQGHTISGIYYTTTTEQFCSIFGVLYANATVKNFAVLNSYLYFGNNYGGGVIGRIDATGVTVKGIYSEAIVESNVGNGTGGILGLVSNTGKDTANVTYAVIEDCVFAGTVNAKGTGQAGGIVGQSANYQFCQAVIKNCANYGTVYGTTAGAIIGMTGNVILDKCLNAGTVTCKNADDETFFNDAMVAAFGGNNLDVNGVNAGRSCVVNNCYNLSENVICRPDTYTGEAYDVTTVLTAEDKGSAIFANGWSARDGYITEDNYPLPTSIFENFFAIDVKYVQSTAVKNGTYSVRFTAEIDSLDFSKAGFKVTATIGGVTKTIDIPVATAYKTVMAGEGEGYAAVTARDGRYYVSITLTDMPAADATYVVTPYTVGDVGEEVEGITKTLNFNANGVLVSAN